MITIIREYNFKADDFFNYLDQQLITAIQKARKNKLPVTLAAGTQYTQGDLKTEIIKYQRGKIYESHFKNNKLDIVVGYQTEDTDNGVKITFTEDVKSYNPKAHFFINNLLYKWQLKMGAKQQLKRMADRVYANMA